MYTSLRWLAVLGICCGVAETSRAAEVLKPPTDFEVSRVKNFIYQSRAGTLPVIDPDSATETAKNRKALQTFAEWLLYTLTQAPYNGELEPKDAPKPPPGVERTADFLIRELEQQVELVPQPGTNRLSVNQVKYGEEMGIAINNAARKVLENSARPIELINAVRMMAITSKMPAPVLADTFVEIINNAKHSDAIKLYAFQGLRRLLEQIDLLDQTKHIIGPRDNTKLAAVTEALSKYILQNRTPRDAREATVIQYVRTEAVAALARCRESVIRKANNEVITRPAWALAHVFSADPNITPGFTVIERSEAAMGFAQMKMDKSVNLDVGAYFVGQALAAFVLQMSQDYGNVNKGLGLPAYPWKIYSARWSYALASWRENTKTSTNKEAVKSLADTAITDILKEVERTAEKAIYNTDNLFRVWPQNNQPKAWLETPAKQAILFADDPTSILPIGVNAKLTTPKTPMPMTPMPMTPLPLPMPKMPPKK
jgi:hypothetical protein